MANKTVHLPVLGPGPSGFGQTLRRDAWWVGPVITVTILLGFIVYATIRAFENDFFAYGPYLSPFYSPFIDTSFAKGLPLPLTPAMLILAGPASFRFTCYYYRKAYYRAFAMDPPACSVGEPNRNYNGETKLLIFQNLHRFALYVAIIFLVFLWHDFIKSLFWAAEYTKLPSGMLVPNGPESIHAGVGSLVMLTNVLLLSGYTFGCHSFRHLIGGSVNSYSTATLGSLRYALWRGVSKLNQRHMLFAWTSLFGVALTDVYVRLVASGAIPDVRIF